MARKPTGQRSYEFACGLIDEFRRQRPADDIALKEGKETLFWLRLLKYASPDRAAFVDPLYRECDEIVAIVVVSLRTKKERLRKERAARKHARTRA
jgi:hypothetical protein